MAEFRPAGDIKPTDARSTFLKKVKQENTKKLADEMRRKAKAQAADSKVRPAKDVKSGDMRSKALREAKKFDAKKIQGAKDLKPGDMRSNFLDDAKQRGPRPARDVKPGDMRSKFLSEAKGAAEARKKAVAEAAEEAVETTAKKRGFGSALGRAAGRVAGPVGALVGMTEEANKGEKEWIADKANRGPLMKGSDGKVSGKTFDKGKGTAALPRAKELPSKTGVLGGSGVQGTGVGSERKITFGANAKERDFYRGDSAPPKPKAKPATDKSRLAGKKAEKVVQGAKASEAKKTFGSSPKKVSAFAEATRRGRSDEYIKASMRPKGNLMNLFRSKSSAKTSSGGAAKPLSSAFAKKNLAANQKIGKR